MPDDRALFERKLANGTLVKTFRPNYSQRDMWENEDAWSNRRWGEIGTIVGFDPQGGTYVVLHQRDNHVASYDLTEIIPAKESENVAG